MTSTLAGTARELDANVYDVFEFSCFRYGGIGGGKSYEANADHSYNHDKPVCIFGHAEQLGWFTDEFGPELRKQYGWLVEPIENDIAVARVNRDKGYDVNGQYQRVTWREYASARGFVRGPHPE